MKKHEEPYRSTPKMNSGNGEYYRNITLASRAVGEKSWGHAENYMEKLGAG